MRNKKILIRKVLIALLISAFFSLNLYFKDFGVVIYSTPFFYGFTFLLTLKKIYTEAGLLLILWTLLHLVLPIGVDTLSFLFLPIIAIFFAKILVDIGLQQEEKLKRFSNIAVIAIAIIPILYFFLHLDCGYEYGDGKGGPYLNCKIFEFSLNNHPPRALEIIAITSLYAWGPLGIFYFFKAAKRRVIKFRNENKDM